MHGRILFNPKQFGRLALLGVVMAMSACGGGDSASTTSPTAALGANEVAPVSGQTVATTLASQTVDSTGAIIKTPEIELSIPSGALQQPTKITIEKLSEIPPEYSSWLSPSARVYKLSPEGTKFNTDITLKIYSPLVDNDDDKIGILWSASGQSINLVPYVRDGNYLVGKSNHFSFASVVENNLILRTAWKIAKKAGAVASANAEIAGKVFYFIGAVDMATLCTFQGRGGVGQPPCSGPKQEDGTYDPLCFGSAYSGVDGDLSINPRTNLCWKPVKPTLGLLKSSYQVLGDETAYVEPVFNKEHVNSFKIVQPPLHGTPTIYSDGSFTYYPKLNYVGSDSFSFVAVNEIDASDPVTVTIEVKAIDVVSSVDPSTASLDVPTTFTVTGKNLTDALTFALQNCSNIRSLQNGIATKYATTRQFSCTPTVAGVAKGVVSVVQPWINFPFGFSVDVKRGLLVSEVAYSCPEFDLYCGNGGSNARKLYLYSDGRVDSESGSGALLTGAIDLVEMGQGALIRFDDGNAAVLGPNTNGELGVGDRSPRLNPTYVASLRGVTSVAGGSRHAIARLADGSVVVSGDNSLKQLGSERQSSNIFVKVNLGGPAISVAAQGDSSYAVMSDGSVLSWGADSRGSLGNGASKLALQLPKPVMISSNTQLGSVISVETIIGGASPAAATLIADGAVFGWGSSDSGIIPGAKSDTYFATAIPGLPPISKLRANNGYFYALAQNGSVWFWGADKKPVSQISVLPKIDFLTTIDRSTVAWAADGRRFILEGKSVTVLSN